MADEEDGGGVERVRGVPAPVGDEVVEVERKPGHGEQDHHQDQHLRDAANHKRNMCKII